MNELLFLTVYIILLILMIIFEVRILSNDKSKYLMRSYKSLNSICENSCNREKEFDVKEFSHEINRFYNEYIQEMPQLKKIYPNVVLWLDAIIFRIDSGNSKASVLKQYSYNLKSARDILEEKNPFNKCEKYQQDILLDIQKVKTPENQIVVQNIVSRTEEEFLRLSADIKKNYRLNIVSLTIGIIGIIVSILMAILKF